MSNNSVKNKKPTVFRSYKATGDVVLIKDSNRHFRLPLCQLKVNNKEGAGKAWFRADNNRQVTNNDLRVVYDTLKTLNVREREYVCKTYYNMSYQKLYNSFAKPISIGSRKHVSASIQKSHTNSTHVIDTVADIKKAIVSHEKAIVKLKQQLKTHKTEAKAQMLALIKDLDNL